MKTPAPKVNRAEALLISQNLQSALLVELSEGPRTNRYFVEKFGMNRDFIHNTLEKLRLASMVDSSTNRCRGEDGRVIGAIWSLSDRPFPADVEPEDGWVIDRKPFTIPRDPWIWALHGAQP